MAIRKIDVGEELTFDYGDEFNKGRWAFDCACSACVEKSVDDID